MCGRGCPSSLYWAVQRSQQLAPHQCSVQNGELPRRCTGAIGSITGGHGTGGGDGTGGGGGDGSGENSSGSEGVGGLGGGRLGGCRGELGGGEAGGCSDAGGCGEAGGSGEAGGCGDEYANGGVGRNGGAARDGPATGGAVRVWLATLSRVGACAGELSMMPIATVTRPTPTAMQPQARMTECGLHAQLCGGSRAATAGSMARATLASSLVLGLPVACVSPNNCAYRSILRVVAARHATLASSTAFPVPGAMSLRHLLSCPVPAVSARARHAHHSGRPQESSRDDDSFFVDVCPRYLRRQFVHAFAYSCRLNSAPENPSVISSRRWAIKSRVPHEGARKSSVAAANTLRPMSSASGEHVRTREHIASLSACARQRARGTIGVHDACRIHVSTLAVYFLYFYCSSLRLSRWRG